MDGSLSKRHSQLFIKRLRRALSPKRIRFFLCGEYGDQLGRPHYHVLLFGESFLSDRSLHRKTATGNTFISPTLDALWGLGHCEIGAVTLQSAGYVARYSMKKITGDRAAAHYKRVNTSTGEIYSLQPEFLLMSLKPGIGQKWFDEFSSDLYPDDFVVYKGKKMRVPRFYDGKHDQGELAALKKSRRARALTHWQNNTAERLAVREEVKLSQIKTLTRS